MQPIYDYTIIKNSEGGNRDLMETSNDQKIMEASKGEIEFEHYTVRYYLK